MADLLEEMSAFFNRVAANYNTVHLEHVGGIESKHIIASFLPKHTKTIIDFGIGTGLDKLVNQNPDNNKQNCYPAGNIYVFFHKVFHFLAA